MSLIQKIINIGIKKGVKEAQLYIPAKACYEEPARGFNVVNEFAPLVVRDCAYVARQYIPVFVFNEVTNCAEELRKVNVTKAEITEFIELMEKQESKLSKGCHELYLSILECGSKYLVKDDGVVQEVVIKDVDIDHNNVYGNYSNYVDRSIEDDHECNDFIGTPAEMLEAILIP